MNNSNGAALLAIIKPGALVTIRDPEGRTINGRAQWSERWKVWTVASARNAALRETVTATNLVRVHNV